MAWAGPGCWPVTPVAQMGPDPKADGHPACPKDQTYVISHLGDNTTLDLPFHGVALFRLYILGSRTRLPVARRRAQSRQGHRW